MVTKEEKDLNINDLVLSSNFGLGKIVGFEELEGNPQTFVVIESLEKKIKLMSPLVDRLNFRKISNTDTLLQKIDDLKKMNGKKDFESKKDRITYFKSRSGHQDLDSIMQTISELREIGDRGSVENKIYDSLVDSIKLELKTVMDSEKSEVDEIVDGSLVK